MKLATTYKVSPPLKEMLGRDMAAAALSDRAMNAPEFEALPDGADSMTRDELYHWLSLSTSLEEMAAEQEALNDNVPFKWLLEMSKEEKGECEYKKVL